MLLLILLLLPISGGIVLSVLLLRTAVLIVWLHSSGVINNIVNVVEAYLVFLDIELTNL